MNSKVDIKVSLCQRANEYSDGWVAHTCCKSVLNEWCNSCIHFTEILFQ